MASREDRDRFNSFVSASPQGDVLQSYEWGEVKRAGGWTPLRLIVENDGRAAASCSILITRPARMVPPIAYAPRGPVLGDLNRSTFDEITTGIRAHTRGAFVFVCDPPAEAGSEAAALFTSVGFRRVEGHGFGGIQPKAVMVLNLEPDLEKILASFKSKWRYNIRVAERRGVSVREGNRGDLGAFYDLLLETARRDGFFIRGRSYFETLWDVLYPAEMLHMFLAEFDGRPIAGVILFCMGSRVVYTYGASSNEHRNVMPNHLIQWHAIRWAKEAGYLVYDFRGVSPVREDKPVEPHLAGLNRFKEGFGARYVEYAGQFDLPLRKGWYGLWRKAGPAAMSVRKKIRPPTMD